MLSHERHKHAHFTLKVMYWKPCNNNATFTQRNEKKKQIAHDSIRICYIIGMCCASTYWGLMRPYGNINLGPYWFKSWLVAWRHQSITWKKVGLSSMSSSGNRELEISQEIPQSWISWISLKITYLKFHSNHSGSVFTDELYLMTTFAFQVWESGNN